MQVVTLCGSDAVREFGLLTTPQLHFAVRQYNRGLPHTEAAYYDEARPDALSLL